MSTRTITFLTLFCALVLEGAALAGPLSAGFSAKTITPIGPSPAGWDFWAHPVTGVWSEEFVDENQNGCYDPPDPEAGFAGESYTDDDRNTMIDPGSALKWDGIWTNAGFGGRCALGKLDDTWARAVVVSNGTSAVAMVSLDVVGYFYEEVQAVKAELAAARPDVDLRAIIIASTHTHEGPDTMGLWGQVGFVVDGKFPLYMQWIRSRIVEAIAEAWDARAPARVRFAKGFEDRGLRDSRPPQVIDPDVWSAQFETTGDTPRTLGTIVNWSNHPEALGSGNNFISSDFAHGVREKMEAQYGGTSIYFSGSVGGLMTPLGVTNIPGFPTDDRSYARTLKLGEIVADAAIAALEAQNEWLVSSGIYVARKEFDVPVENLSLTAIALAGGIDRAGYVGTVPTGPVGFSIKTEMLAVGLGPAVFITVPGELFPEIANGGYGRPECPEADTGRPHEPVIRDQFDGYEYKFLFGLGQDELGYIVPGYDFWIFGLPPNQAEDNPIALSNQARPALTLGLLEAIDPCGEDHYEETVSAGSRLAPLVACSAAQLAGKRPFDDPVAYPACTRENTSTGPLGLDAAAFLVPPSPQAPEGDVPTVPAP